MTKKQFTDGLTDLGKDIWSKKYQFNNETPEEWTERVSGGNKKVAALIRDHKALFGGRTLSNRGTGRRASYSNCYSLGFVGDSLDEIMQANTDIAKTFKAQGGQGISLSHIRPKGSPIAGGQFTSDGILPFMKIYNQTTASISQGGARKGALIITLDAKHKEAETFIHCKANNDQITKANLSLELDDDFMQAAKEGKPLTVKSKWGDYEIEPRKILMEAAENAWDWGEPGAIFTNRFRNYNIMEKDQGYKIETCNPCVTGDTLILTKEYGYVEIRKVTGKKVSVWNGYEWSEVTPEVMGHDQKMKHISFSDGSDLFCTDYHKFILQKGFQETGHSYRAEAKDLHVGDKLVKCEFPVIEAGEDVDEKTAYTQGFFSGDGWAESGRKRLDISLYGKKKRLVPYLAYHNLVPQDEKNAIWLVLDYDPVTYDKDFVPDISYSVKSRLDWLAGYIDADGSKNSSDGSITITSVNRDFLIRVKYLLNTLGVNGTVALMKDAETKEMPANDGTGGMKPYECQKRYRLSISAVSVMKLLNLGLNFHRVKTAPMPNRDASRYIRITDIDDAENADTVYCFTEPKNHSGIFNGVITSNCGEQPLPAGGACNLASINLAAFVEHPFEERACLSNTGLLEAVDTMIEALDDVLDENINNHALEKQKQMAHDYRNVGLGIMGMGDMLIMLGLRYGSEESINFMDEVMEEIFRQAVITSNRLAKEKGAFPKYTEAVWDSEIMRAHFSDKEIADLKKDGLRNCSLLSIAPSGSIATMLNISTGAEPNFAFHYMRKTESLNGDVPTYYKVYTGVAEKYHAWLKKTAEEGGLSDEETHRVLNTPLPDFFVSAGDIPWKERVAMQAALQKHVDTGISSTVNLPETATPEQVFDLLVEAWEKGCKGITVFRDNCKRTGILTHDAPKKEEKKEAKKEEPVTEPKRGEILPPDDSCIGLKRTITTGCGTLHVEAFFKPDTGDLFETYFSKGSTGGCNSFMTGLSRMVSLAARAGVPFEAIIDQLKSTLPCTSYVSRHTAKHDTSAGTCCPSAIAYALVDMHEQMMKMLRLAPEIKGKEESIEDTDTGNRCPDCGSTDLQFTNGCVSCPHCGWSRCS